MMETGPDTADEPFQEPGEPFGEPAEAFAESAEVFHEPAGTFGEVFGEPAEAFGESAEVFHEPAGTFGEVFGEPAEAFGESAGAVREPGERWPATGEPRVDAALARLDELDGRPVTEHRLIFEDVHRRLRDVLGELDTREPPQAQDATDAVSRAGR